MLDKKAVVAIIMQTVEAWTGGRGNAIPLLSMAVRESGLNPEARGDTGIDGPAAAAWTRNKASFAGSRWAGDDARWQASLGLYQLMPANYLQHWDRMADPWSLLDPWIATVVAARGLNRAQALGAKTVLDARMIWAFGPRGLNIPKTDARYTDRLASERARLEKLGADPDLALASIASLGLSEFGRGPQADQEARIAALRSGDQTPRKTRSPLAMLAIAALIWRIYRA